MGKEGPKDRLEMSREPTWAKKVPKDRLEMVSRKPTWAGHEFKSQLGQRGTRNDFKKANLGKEGPKDRLEMVSREPAWAKRPQG